MSDNRILRHYVCQGPALTIVRKYLEVMNEMEKAQDALRADFQAQAVGIQEQHFAKMQVLWERLSGFVGLDPRKTWGNPDYYIETRFVESGFAAVIYSPAPPHPMAMPREAGPPSPDAGELKPDDDKGKLH